MPAALQSVGVNDRWTARAYNLGDAPLRIPLFCLFTPLRGTRARQPDAGVSVVRQFRSGTAALSVCGAHDYVDALGPRASCMWAVRRPTRARFLLDELTNDLSLPGQSNVSRVSPCSWARLTATTPAAIMWLFGIVFATILGNVWDDVAASGEFDVFHR